MKVRLPFMPETLDVMQARFPLAIEKIIDRRDAMTALDANNIFDFTDGLRIVVTMERDEREPPPGIMQHVWAWAQPASRVMTWIESGAFRRPEHFAIFARKRFKDLSGIDLPDKCWMSPTIGIPHWFVPQKVTVTA